MMENNNKKVVNKKRVFLIIAFIILIIGSLLIGASTKVTFLSLIKFEKEAWFIFTQSRIPRTITIILTASALSIGGLIMQSVNRNKFISPSTAGTTDAASLGILIAFLVIPKRTSAINFIFAFSFALLFTALFIYMMQKIKFKNVIYVPLVGMMYGALIGALSTLLAQSFGIQQILSTLNLGSFTGITLSNFSLILWVIPPLIMAIIFSTKFSIVALGEDLAKNLGVNYAFVMMVGIFIVSVISASTFIVVGPLPFVGLIIPNLVSMFYGDNFKKNLFDIALFGSCFVLINDIVSRILVKNSEVPVSFTMGVIGSIIFLYLIFRRRK